MTKEKLEKALDIQKTIKEKEENFLKLKEFYLNNIYFKTNQDEFSGVCLEGQEAKEVIDVLKAFFAEKIEALKIEFEEL